MAGDKGKLTREQRAEVRARWEGCDIEGFDWLAKEASHAFSVTVSRQAIAKAAAKGAWVKGGPPRGPLAVLPGATDPEPPTPAARQKRVSAVAQPLSEQPQGEQPPAQQQQALSVVLPAERVDAEPVDDSEGDSRQQLRRTGPGRPSKYRPEFAAAIVRYFDVEPTEERTVTGFGGVTKIQVIARKPPLLVRFAQSIGVSVDTLGRWATDVGEDGSPRFPDFAAAYTRARQLLEALLQEGAALGVYEGKVIQFMLKNLYGWRDQPEKDVVVAPVSTELLDTLYIQGMARARERQRLVLEERARLRAQEGEGR